MNNSTTSHCVKYICSVGYKELPEKIVEMALRCIMDWFGVAIGGMNEPAVKIVADYVMHAGGDEQATILGYWHRTSVANAALVNGTMAHALDFDDAHMYTRSHLSAPLLASLLAVSEHSGSSGSELIAAFVLGFEISSRIGLALGLSYYDRGWHSTSVLGRFAAAVGVGKLLGLGEHEMNHALGLAATQAGGIRQSFGTMAKPFHVGKAAMDGIISADLASRGFTACEAVLDADSGFGAMLSPGYDPGCIDKDLGDRFSLVDISFKPYAACLALHPSITGVLALKQEHSLDPGAIESIHLEVAPICIVLGDHPFPENGLRGKFSIQYCSALALTEGHVGKGLFSDELVTAPHIRNLIERTTLSETKSLQESEALVEIVLQNGERYAKHVEAPKGDPRNPLSLDEIVEKTRELAGEALSEGQIEMLISGIRQLPELEDIRGLIERCKVRNKHIED